MLSMLFFIILLCIIITVNWQLRPLGKIAEATDAIAQGNFNTKLPIIKGHSDISHLRDSFVSMQSELTKYIGDLRATTEKKANMERDLLIAAKIQQGMLLKVFPAFPDRGDIDIYGMQRAAKEVGGDIFDFLMHDDRLYFLIGDVSGKGVPASLFMTVVGHLFRNVARYSTSASVIVEAINNGLAEGNDEDMFCTLFCGVLDMQTGKVEYCNAGHNAPIWVHNGKTDFMTPEVNLPTGVMGEFEYKSETMQLSEGDALFLYTDGVTEAENRNKDLFGDTSALAMVDLLKDMTMKDLSDGVYDAVKQFVDGYEQSDDLTMLCLRWRGRKA
jgi:sigma-B regulation protein RsbU (phosphoserine phosphatase)